MIGTESTGMNPDKIAELVKSVDVSFEWDKDIILYWEAFCAYEDEEPDDLAQQLLYDANERLESVGLKIVESWSDNDSVGGIIVEV